MIDFIDIILKIMGSFMKQFIQTKKLQKNIRPIVPNHKIIKTGVLIYILK